MFMKNNKFPSFRIALALVLIAGVFGAMPARASEKTSQVVSSAEFLNDDGILNLDGNTSASFQPFDTAQGGSDSWDVQLDPDRGPIFSPENREAFSLLASSMIGQWSALGSNLDGTDGAISHPGPPGTAEEVDVIAVSGTDVYVGGCFQNAGGDPTADYVAKWDTLTASWSGLGSDGTATPNGALKSCIRALAINGPDVYVGGYPSVWVGGAPAPHAEYLARWNGTSWSGLIDSQTGGSIVLNPGDVTSIAISGSNVYVGGYFSTIYKWDGAYWSTLGGSGTLNSYVDAMKFINSDLYVGGGFTAVYNGSDLVPEAAYIAKWDTVAENWSALGTNGDLPGGPLNGGVYGLATDGTNLYVAGGFTDINNYGTILSAADRIAKWDGTNWSALGSNGVGNGSLSSPPIAIQVSGSDIYIGGAFTDINNNGTVLAAADYVAKWDTLTGNWSALGSDGSGNGSLNHNIHTLGLVGDKLYVGGRFTNVNNNGTVLNTADYIAAYAIGDGIYRVTPTGVSTPSCGDDWSNPCDLQYALTSMASPGDEIWVAAGTYKPTTTTDRTVSFTLKNGVAIYGGFAGTETLRTQRNPSTNVTILSGEIGAADIADNSYHVVVSSGTNNTAVLDGFTITAGNANHASLSQHQDGGGVFNGGTLIITNTTISGNSADFVGGGIFNYGTLTITNSAVSGNSAGNAGGGIANNDSPSDLIITNSTFSGNSAGNVGGGIVNIGALTITNSTLSDNSASNAGSGIFNSAVMNYSNTIIADAVTGSDCYNDVFSGGLININTNNLVETNAASPTNCGNPTIVADPKLEPLTNNGGFTQTMALGAGSPAIDAGNDATCMATDQRGVTRPQGSHCDIGAYEYEPVIRYVKWNAGGANNGTSWANAYTDLQSALSAASSGDEIWVAAGTYKSTVTTDRTISFTLKNGVAIYGGFAGTETLRTQRDPSTNVTILSGEIGAAGIADNSYHVVVGGGTNNTAVLDGFTITAGNANGTFPNNWGGGMFNNGSSPTLKNLTFTNSSAEEAGGGMANANSSPNLMNITFHGNTANFGSGGGIFNASSNTSLSNVTFNNNSAGSGGGMYNTNSSPNLTNVTFSGNLASSAGGGIYNISSNPTIKNSILWGDTGIVEIVNTSGSSSVVSYSIVQGGYAGTGNLNADPLLGALADNGGFTQTMALGAGSPAIDAGDDTICADTATVNNKDQRGVTRPQGSHCDIGAYEYADPAGFYVSGRYLLDANGNNFIMRGVNHGHNWYLGETSSFANIKAKGANTVRVVLSSGQNWPKNGVNDVANVVSLCKANKLVCVLEVHDTTGYGEAAGAVSLAQSVTYWEEIKSALIGQEAYVIINIGNEPYGNANPSNWINDTKNAIADLRSAGLHHTLMIDAPNWGQDWQYVMRDNAASVFNSDPDKNIIFSIHMYGVYETATSVQNYVSAFVNAGLPLVIGEFAHQHTDGDPDENAIMSVAQANGIGYLGWVWSGGGYLDMVNTFNANQVTWWGDRIISGKNGIHKTSCEASVYGGDSNPKLCNITRSDPNPALSESDVDFLAIFSEPVTGVDAGDFSLTTTGVTGASITGVSGSGNTYTVTVDNGSGKGTIRLDVVDNDSIKDTGNNPLGGAGSGSGNFSNGETYTINTIVPLDPTKISFQEIASGLTKPVFITHAGDGSGRIFIVEQPGRIRIRKNGSLLTTPFLDIQSLVKSTGSEQGLLALAFDPSYAVNGNFYVAYTAPRNGDSTGSNLVLQKFSVSANNPDLANPNSGVILLTISHPTYSNHNGGTLAFGQDGYLYWSTGDGGSGGDPGNNAQNLSSLLGKILRINVHSGAPYGIPSTNPFYASADPNIKKEIWAYGLRNPWRLSFDRLTHDLYIGDVGQSAREEVDFQSAGSVGGENYGWRVMEGSICYNPSTGCNQSAKVLPVAEYDHTLGCSITGGYVYRGLNFSSPYGHYFYGDYCTGRLFSLYKDPLLGWRSSHLLDTSYYISTFGEDEQGELYLADFATGKIYNIRYQDTFTISGTVGVGGATLGYTDGTTKSVTADGSGNYTIMVPSGWNGIVTPAHACYTFNPASRPYTNVTANQASQNYTATYISSSYTLTGNVGMVGVKLNYTDGTPKTVTSDGSGNYSITVPCNWSGTVTPSLIDNSLDLGFIPASKNYTNVTINQTAQDYTIKRLFSDLSMWTTDFNYNTQGWRVEKHPRLLGDVNNDGRDDIIGYGYDGVWVALSTGTGFAPVTLWTTDYSYTAQGWRTELHPRLVGDVNGDGRADLVGFGYSGVWIALSDGTKFLPVSMWTTDFNYNTQGWRVEKHPRMMGDVNNDGRDDIIGYGYDGVWVALSTGTSFAPVTLWTTDYSYTAQGWRVELHPRMVGDFNGDGRADLIGFGYAGAWIALSTGTSFAPVTMWTSDFNYNTQGWRVEKHPRVIGDVNGDGKDDIIGYGYDGVWIALSTGTGFTTPVSMWTSNYSYTAQGWRVELHPRMVGDPNGDGMDDLVGFGYAGVWINK